MCHGDVSSDTLLIRCRRSYVAAAHPAIFAHKKPDSKVRFLL